MNRFVGIVFLLIVFVFSIDAKGAAIESIHSTDFAVAKASLKSESSEKVDSSKVYQLLAVASASAKNKEKAAFYLDAYLKRTADLSILENDAFDNLKDTPEFESISNTYLPRLNALTFIYLYVALIGFFIAFIITFTKNCSKTTSLLIAGFIAIHSLFILEFVFYYSNYSLRYPHTYLMSSLGALLYGPLLYLYFKKITQNYQLRAIDLLHFLPSAILMIVLFPLFTLPMEEKIKIQLGSSAIYSQTDFLYIIFIPKLISLIIYGFFISKLYYKEVPSDNSNSSDSVVTFWKRGVYRMHIIYVLSYFIYGISISGILFNANELLYHSQVISMSMMVVYVSGMAYIQPKVFNLEYYGLTDNDSSISKYQKSSLTETFSLELKEKLMDLLVDKKVYKDNSINLDKLSNKLNTSRHNTSQIINEHFNENFYEFLNDYRIDEAKKLLLVTNGDSKMNINEILYEVGFNNKVSFNNAFKKRTGLTPTQFRNRME
ncbi:MAG: helix-turn-helix domain-containing protein [Gelidibacter sp.]